MVSELCPSHPLPLSTLRIGQVVAWIGRMNPQMSNVWDTQQVWYIVV